MSSYSYSIKWAPSPKNSVLIKRENWNRHMYRGRSQVNGKKEIEMMKQMSKISKVCQQTSKSWEGSRGQISPPALKSNQSFQHLDRVLLTSRLWDNIFMLFKSSSWWYLFHQLQQINRFVFFSRLEIPLCVSSIFI